MPLSSEFFFTSASFGFAEAAEIDAPASRKKIAKLVGLYESDSRLWRSTLEKAIEKAPEALSLVRLRANEWILDGEYLPAGQDFMRFTPIAEDANHPLNTATL